MIKQFEDLSEIEQARIAEVQTELYKLLKEYERLTGARELFDEVEPFIWDTVDFQALELA